MKFSAICYEADISVDLILSFPWLEKNKIGVFPHPRALVVDEPRLLLLFGETDRTQSNHRVSRRRINRISAVYPSLGLRLDTYSKFPLSLPMTGAQNCESVCRSENYRLLNQNR